MFQVRKLLADDPGNSEYADMEKELEEVSCIDALVVISETMYHLTCETWMFTVLTACGST